MLSVLRGAGRSKRLRDLGDLVARPHDAVAGFVLDGRRAVLLGLGALPDFDLHAAADDADSHRRQQVVRGVGVVVDAAVEDGGGVLADAALDHGPPAGVVLDEG